MHLQQPLLPPYAGILLTYAAITRAVSSTLCSVLSTEKEN